MRIYFNLTPKRIKLIRLIFAVITALLALFAAEQVSAAHTFYVPGDYATIQQAVNAAASGDTIIVKNGCYSENIKVAKSDLTIKSESGADKTIISSADGTSDVFQFDRSRTTISGFTIKNARSGSGINIKYSSAENIIKNNQFSDNEQGIFISMFSYFNEITNNNFGATNNYGLYLQSGYDAGSGAARKSSANSIFLNDFYSKINAGSAGRAYYNFWKTPDEKDYVYNGGYYKSRLGNHYVFYDGSDDNGDGIGDTSQPLGTESGAYPLMMPSANYEILAQEPDWTFAVLTDLHIGWGIPDYGQPGYGEDDSLPGQEYYLTERLNAAVSKINERKAKDNIKFVVVLGDITDTAEYSEFLKAREILNKLEIPYIPIIGNHDIWPYISNPNHRPDSRAIPFTTIKLGIGETAGLGQKTGDEYFEQVFWRENPKNTDKINALFADFSRPVHSEKLQNCSFEYQGVKFIGLDFASRNKDTQLFSMLNATDITATIDYLQQQLAGCGDKKIVLLTHYPLNDYVGGFIVDKFENIKELLINSKCNFLNLSGHSHNNKLSKPYNLYPVLETESVSQTKFLFEKAENRFLRILTPNKWIDLLTDNYDDFITASNSAINPYIVMHPAKAVPFQSSLFIAGSNNEAQDKISAYTWQFDNEEPITTNSNRIVKYISQTGKRKVKLTMTDIDGNQESLAWDYSVVLDTRPGRKVEMVGGTLIPVLYTGENLRDQEYAQNTEEWVFITNNDHKLLGAIDAHFELANTDIDLSDLAADLDASQRAVFMHMDSWPAEIENNKILYIPSTGKGRVYICPQADSLDKVKPNCQDATILTVGETKNGMTVSEINYNGQPYYQVYGITGTGGGELDLPANSSLESQIQITKLEYDGEDILNQAAADIGDKRLPLLLSELKQDKINLTVYLPQEKKKLNPWQEKKLNYKFKFLESIDNEWQNKKIKAWFNFEAKQ